MGELWRHCPFPSHVDPVPLPCAGKRFSTAANWREHLHEKHLKHSVFCPGCGGPFGSGKYLKRHKERCNRPYDSAEALRRKEAAQKSDFGILSSDIREYGRDNPHQQCGLSPEMIIARLFERCREGFHDCTPEARENNNQNNLSAVALPSQPMPTSDLGMPIQNHFLSDGLHPPWPHHYDQPNNSSAPPFENVYYSQPTATPASYNTSEPTHTNGYQYPSNVCQPPSGPAESLYQNGSYFPQPQHPYDGQPPPLLNTTANGNAYPSYVDNHAQYPENGYHHASMAYFQPQDHGGPLPFDNPSIPQQQNFENGYSTHHPNPQPGDVHSLYNPLVNQLTVDASHYPIGPIPGALDNVSPPLNSHEPQPLQYTSPVSSATPYSEFYSAPGPGYVTNTPNTEFNTTPSPGYVTSPTIQNPIPPTDNFNPDDYHYDPDAGTMDPMLLHHPATHHAVRRERSLANPAGIKRKKGSRIRNWWSGIKRFGRRIIGRE